MIVIDKDFEGLKEECGYYTCKKNLCFYEDVKIVIPLLIIGSLKVNGKLIIKKAFEAGGVVAKSLDTCGDFWIHFGTITVGKDIKIKEDICWNKEI